MLIISAPIFIEKYNYFALTNINPYLNGVFFQCLFNFANGCICYYLFSKIKFFFNDLMCIINTLSTKGSY